MLNPTVLIEVLSPSTETDDRGPKLDCYEAIASVRAVVLVAQDEPEVTLHERRVDGTWSQTSHRSGAVTLTAIGCALPLAEVYEDLPNEQSICSHRRGACPANARELGLTQL